MNLNINILESYKKINEKYLDDLLKIEIEKNNKKIIVLDDDPTGVQTIHDINVYTNWNIESIREGFKEENRMFFILTNSRSFTAEETTKCHKEIIERVEQISKETGIEYMIVSRGDSTLRGHYPLETDILREGFEKSEKKKIDGEILCPFFKEGGRFTLNNIHYVKLEDTLYPAGETEFAKDKTFGYTSSNLCNYIEEKTGGKILTKDVLVISLEELRNQEIENIEKKLLNTKNHKKIVVNAIDYCDLKVFIIALYRAINRGKNFIFRTAASFVKVLGNISDRKFLVREDMIKENSKNGGIIIVGSHTKKTTSQLNELKRLDNLEFIEFNSDLVLNENEFKKEIENTIEKEEKLILEGKTVVVYTKRKLLVIDNDTKEEALLRSVKISDAVQSLVGKLKVTPAFVVAKGGITSSDIGTKALQVKRARVLGQVCPGIPVWQTEKESKFPNIPYVIFPGNVGETTTLKEVVEILLGGKNGI